MNQSKSSEYSNKILELCRMEAAEDIRVLIDEAYVAYRDGNYTKIDEIVKKIRGDFRLLETLIGKLKGKSVYTGLRNLVEGKDQSNEQAIISTASLISHVAIEMKENKEYRKLLPDLYRKLGVLISKGE